MSFSKRLLSGDAPALVPGENFKVVLYTGNSASDNSGTTQTITGVGFQPDWVVIKRRDGTENHYAQDSTRGSTKQIYWNLTNAEYDETNAVTSFNSDGFVVSGYNGTNNNGETYVAWCWKSGGGTTSTNSNGSINSTVQTNSNAGFSIVKFTGTGAQGTIGHGLSSAPELIISKRLDATNNWNVYHKDLGLSHTSYPNWLYLNLTSSEQNSGSNANHAYYQAPSSTLLYQHTGTSESSNVNNGTYISYCFHSVDGFSKIGSYTGNGSTNGPVVETGFEPAFLMVKNTTSADNWAIFDNKRNTSNPRNTMLQANLNAADNSEVGAVINFYSNGFQSIGTGGGGGSGQVNKNNNVYIYMAFAADPDEEAPTVASSFNIETYIGTGAARSITGLGFKPGLVWTKDRGNAEQHQLHDIVRGPTHALASNLSNAQATRTGGLTSFDNDGFSLGADGGGVINDSSRGPYIAWTWKADDNEPTINSNGTGIDSFTSVNDAAGFSIVQYTGTGNASHTVGHGLSSTPKLLIHKSLDNGQGWAIVHDSLSSGYNIGFNGNAQTNSMGNDGSITKGDVGATTFGFTAGASTVNGANLDGNRYIAYCFNDVTGYQKIGSYNGSGSNGNSITTGFKPDFVLVKRSNSSGGWLIFDTKRSNSNPVNDRIEANNDQAEQTNSGDKHITITATAFEANGSDSELNASGGTYIYWAVAKNVPSNTTLANSFNAAFYTGSSTDGRTISNFGFRPDLVWIKKLSATDLHVLTDAARGQNKQLFSNQSDAQSASNTRITSFDTNGFTLDGTSSNRVNGSANSFIAWGWKAGQTWQSNIDGTQGCLVNANTANGFSIVKWTTNGSSSQTVGHGLSSTPELVIYKRLDSSQDWFVETNAIDGSYDYGNLNNNNALTTNEAGAWSTRATSTTITNFTSSNNFEYIAYCWHSVSGYSDIGVYTGNGSSTGPTITTGFKTDFVLIKRVEGAASWAMVDSLRGGGQELYANLDDADNAYTAVDFKSNGFQIVNTANGYNANGEKYLYMAFAKNATNNNTLANSFKVKTYTGNGSTQQITGIGFKPDLVWIKQRNDTNPHSFFDTTRGAGKMLVTSTNAAEINNPGDILGHFNDDGFQVNRNHGVHTAYDNSNHSSSTYVAWCWKAGNGWQSNYDGAISSLTNANTGNGFSIVRWEGTGSATTIGHDLGVAPGFIIGKTLDSAAKWRVYHSGIGATKAVNLNDTDAAGTSANYWNDTAPTSSVFSVGSDLSVNGEKHIAYVWTEISGFSKFGTYTGNGLASGTVASTGFTPDFVLVKETTTTSDWGMFDSERSGTYYQKALFANENDAEMAEMNVNSVCEFLPVGHNDAANGGFRFRDSGSQFNVDGNDYIFIAFKMN